MESIAPFLFGKLKRLPLFETICNISFKLSVIDSLIKMLPHVIFQIRERILYKFKYKVLRIFIFRDTTIH